MRVKERVNERGLRRDIMKEKSKLIHEVDMLRREFARLFKMVNEEISEFKELIVLGG